VQLGLGMEAIDLNNSEEDQAEDLLLPKITAQPNVTVQQNVSEEEVIDITMQSDVLIFILNFIVYRLTDSNFNLSNRLKKRRKKIRKSS